MHATDYSWVSDMELVQRLTETELRPSLLVQCKSAEPDDVVTSLISWCSAPVHICRLPGTLALPPRRAGTIVLADVTAMSLAQQIQLQDWLGADPGAVQIVSVACEPLWPLVQQGRFLEGLFYRLNVVTLEAKESPKRR